MRHWKQALSAGVASLALAGATSALAQAAPPPPPPAAAPAPPAPVAMSTPAMGAVLTANPNPFSVDTGPAGKIYIGGALTGLAFTQSNVVPGDHSSWGDISNAQVFIQKTDGLVQFFVEAGDYSIPVVGSPYVKSSSYVGDTYGVVPVAYLKLQPSSSFSIIAGKLPTLIGAEGIFTFQNNDIQRGLVWNQEPVVSRGVQLNYTHGPFTLSASWNDGYYSNRFNWGSGLISFALTPRDTLTLAGGGNFGSSATSTFATPVPQNNSDLFNVIFTHSQGPFAITPYFQYTYVPTNTSLGIYHSASTVAGAVLVKYSFTPSFSVAARAEYESSSGTGVFGAPNLLFGQDSDAWSLTVTPTYQWKIYYIRAELSYIGVTNMTPGFGFGPEGTDTNQVRGLLETGVLF